MRRPALKGRLERLEQANQPDMWTFTIDTGRTVRVPVTVVLEVLIEGLGHVHDPDPGRPPPSADLMLLARVTATSETSLLGRSVVQVAQEARQQHEANKENPDAD